MQQQQINAELILRLLWGAHTPDDSLTLRNPDTDFNSLAKLAHKNLVIIRLAHRLQEERFPVAPAILTLAEQEKQRIHETINLIGTITSLLQKVGIDFFFTKSFQHYPDMGHDIDLLVGETGHRVDQILKQSFQARPDVTSLLNKISNKTGYWLDNYPSPVEIHHGLMGHLGEYRSYPMQVMARAVTINSAGIKTRIPSPEDQFLIQVMQRIYGHRNFRLSDLLVGAKLLATENLDWDYIRNTAHEMGITAGVSYYANTVERLYHQATYRSLELHGGIPKTSVKPCFDGYGYKVKELPVVLPLFARKWVSDLSHGRWESAGRLSLMPLPFLIAIFRRVRNTMLPREHAI